MPPAPMPEATQAPTPAGPPKPPPTPNSRKGLEMFSAPIPGQSLTRTPGTYPFEKPPQFTNPEDAFKALVKALTMEKTAIKLMNMLETGFPVRSIVLTVLQGGFMEGKWTVDVALLLSQPLAALIIRMAKEANVKPNLGIPPRTDKTMDMVVEHRLKRAKNAPPQPELEGIMTPPKGMK